MLIQIVFAMEILSKTDAAIKNFLFFFQCRSTFEFYFRFNTHKHCIMLVTVLESGQSQLPRSILEFQIEQLDLEIIYVIVATQCQHYGCLPT